MPAAKRFKTKYPGVYYILGTSAANGKPEKIYYVRYRKGGKSVEEPVGRQFKNAMTDARANTVRAERINGNTLPNRQCRAKVKADKEMKEGRWTIDRLWHEYKSQRKPGRSLTVDSNRYDLYIKDIFGKKEPCKIIALGVDRVRIRLLKKKSPQTVAHILNLLTWIINFGVKKGICQGISFKIEKPSVDNKKTEDLNQEELTRLLDAIDADENRDVGNMMKMALYKGMRRGELFDLQWNDINFDQGFITIRTPKGGKSQKIPLNDGARKVMQDQTRTQSPYVFPGQKGGKRVTAAKASRRIRERAGLPSDFRPFHGLRHVYASMLASSGKVDMYTLQKLITHDDPAVCTPQR